MSSFFHQSFCNQMCCDWWKDKQLLSMFNVYSENTLFLRRIERTKSNNFELLEWKFLNPDDSVLDYIVILPLSFQGTIVAVKKIDKSKFNLNRDLLIELKTVSHRFFSKKPSLYYVRTQGWVGGLENDNFPLQL